MRDNRPAVYVEGDNVIYRASAIGRCLRALWAARNGMERMPIPDIVQMGMDEGTNLESTILELLYEKHHWTFSHQPQFEVELNVGAFNGHTLIVRGKMDEMGCPADPNVPNTLQKHLPIDVKAFTNDECERFRRELWAGFPQYAWQQSVYAHGTGNNCFYMPIFNKGTLEIEPWSLVLYQAPFTRDQIYDRILTVEEAYEANDMPKECPSDYACSYPYLHEQRLTDAPPDEAVPLMKARIVLSDKIKSLEDARKALDDKIKTLLTMDVSYRLDGYSITVFANPDRFNSNAAKRLLQEAGIDWRTDPDYHTPGVGTQIRFTPPKRAKE